MLCFVIYYIINKLFVFSLSFIYMLKELKYVKERDIYFKKKKKKILIE